MKHAYLILSHKNDYTVKSLLKLLDYPENDIYVHMDLKETQYCENDFTSILHNSKIFFTKRTSVTWGGYSLINATLELLELAIVRDGIKQPTVAGSMNQKKWTGPETRIPPTRSANSHSVQLSIQLPILMIGFVKSRETEVLPLPL